jgi:hypothetical protein
MRRVLHKTRMRSMREVPMNSPELDVYLERKAICVVDGLQTEEAAIRIAWDQVKSAFVGKNSMPWLIMKDLQSIGIDPRA